MSLTTGRGPLSENPAGRFYPPVLPAPSRVLYVEPLLRRVRGLSVSDARTLRTLIDSERVLLVHRPGEPPGYAFPERDVPRELRGVEPEPAAAGYVRVPWGAVDAWYEEEEQVFGHPRNPYHRIDCIRARRRLRVALSGVVLVDTDVVIGVYETSRAPQLYVSRQAVRMDRLAPSSTVTYCPYKGHASYWNGIGAQGIVPDVAWSYEQPAPEAAPIAGMLSFYPERATVTQDVPTWFEVETAAEAARTKDERSHG